LLDAYDDEHLSVCETCGLSYPQPVTDEIVSDRCNHCGSALIECSRRYVVVPLQQRGRSIRERLGALRLDM